MKKLIFPLAFLFVLAISSCKTGGNTGNMENVDSLKQVEDIIQQEVVDTTAAGADSLTVGSDSIVAE